MFKNSITTFSYSEFHWLRTHTDAFGKIKCAISDGCSLQFYDISCPLLIECDVSKKGLGCILLQSVDNNMTGCDMSNFSEKEMDEILQHLRPVAYSCKLLSDAET